MTIFYLKPAVITMKKNKSVKIALNSRKLNETTVKRKPQMPNVEELIFQKLLDYAQGQLQLSKRAVDLSVSAVTGGNFTGYSQFLKSFYGLVYFPTKFQVKIDQILENKHPAWLDDNIVVTKGSKEEHVDELIDVLTKLENAGYRLSNTKSESRMDWSQNRPEQYQTVTRQITRNQRIEKAG